MKQFTSVADIANIEKLVNLAIKLKKEPYAYKSLGLNKTLCLVFLNPSLRTRLSSQRAAQNLGMDVIVVNIDKDGWALELVDGTVMDGTGVEHINDAAAVIGQYADIVGIRCFPGLKNREEDYAEIMLHKFIKYCNVPVISLESATLHPLQSLADLITITELWAKPKPPKVVLTWAPHIKPLPQAVANSFAEWMGNAQVDLFITHPEGFELSDTFTHGAKLITTNQDEALQNADFVYIKNWSSYHDYGKPGKPETDWLLNEEKMKITHEAKIMHCLPVRRNLEVPDSLLDGPNSLIMRQAANRIWSAQAVLYTMLASL